MVSRILILYRLGYSYFISFHLALTKSTYLFLSEGSEGVAILVSCAQNSSSVGDLCSTTHRTFL